MKPKIFISLFQYSALEGLKEKETAIVRPILCLSLAIALRRQKDEHLLFFAVCLLTTTSPLAMSMKQATFRKPFTQKLSSVVWIGRWLNRHQSRGKHYCIHSCLEYIVCKEAVSSCRDVQRRDTHLLCCPVSAHSTLSFYQSGWAAKRGAPYKLHKRAVISRVLGSQKHGYREQLSQTALFSQTRASSCAPAVLMPWCR